MKSRNMQHPRVLMIRTLRGIRKAAIRGRNRLRAAPPVVALAAAVFLCVMLITICDYIATSLVLMPLATALFARRNRAVSLAVRHSWGDPVVKADVVIGAIEIPSRPENFSIDYGSLPMQRPEADLIMSYLLPGDIYLEYGSSGTSLAFPPLVASAVTVDTDPHVCEAIASEIGEHHRIHNLQSFCSRMGPSGHNKSHTINAMHGIPYDGPYRDFEEFVELPLHSFPDRKFDKVLINGHARIACALRILSRLKPSSIVFFHDFFMHPEHYSVVLKYYREVSRIMPLPDTIAHQGTGPFGLLVLAPKLLSEIDPNCKSACNLPPSLHPAEIHSIYDAFPQRTEISPLVNNAQAFRFVPGTNSSGYPKDELSRLRAWQTSMDRLALDCVALPIAYLTFTLCRLAYKSIFERALPRTQL